MKQFPVVIGFKTSNDDSDSFDPWNKEALRYIEVEPGAIDPSSCSYHVRGDLYEVPGVAKKGHECGGSINVQGIDVNTRETIEFSHIFYIDVTGHGGMPPHWNHELWVRKGNEFKLFDKNKTEFHVIPISDWIEIWLEDEKGQVESKKVFRPKS